MPIEEWTNWVGNQSCTCEIVTPRTLCELRNAVRTRAAAGRRIRAAGASRSWSPLVPNAETIIRLDGIKDEIKLDGNNAVKVPCGTTIADLNTYLAERNRTLISPTLYPAPQVGGAISTGSHGTGLGLGTFADSIL
jgi:L-gulonolactone oxidase